MKYGKAYPYLKALLDGLLEAAPNWMKAPGKFVSSLSEQLQDKGKNENEKLEQEITSISKDDLRELIKEAGYEHKEDIELIVTTVGLIPEIMPKVDYRFDKVDDKLNEIVELLQQREPFVSVREEHAGRDIYQAGRDIIIHQPQPAQQPPEKVKLHFPFQPSLHNQTPPEENFVGRKEILATITGWYKSEEVRIGALIGWGGVGKSALVRKWYDSLKENRIQPDGIFWWGFYRNAYLEQFLNALLRYVSGWQIEPDTIKGTWEKVERIKEYISQGAYLIILDGLEQMQKSQSGVEFGKMIHREFAELLHYLADLPEAKGLCLITTRFPLKDLNGWHHQGYENRSLTDLSELDAVLMLKTRGVEGNDQDIKEVINRYKGHALSLTLLAGYLKKHHKSDIKQAPQVKFVLSDKKRFQDVHRLMTRYVEKMSKAERIFLNIFSLFRGDITEDDFAGVFRGQIEGTKCNNALVEMNELDFRDLINGLADWRLIACDKTKNTYSTHPLIKGYFEADFSEKNKKLCHKRIYEYFGENAPEGPETLEQMQPLFEQVYHGCAAGFYDEANDIYWNNIQRGAERYLITKLGAWGTDFNLVLNFFPRADISEIPLVSKTRDQRYLLNELGVSLINIGRPKEGEGLLTRAVTMHLEDKSWSDASIDYRSYRSLTDLQFRCGKIEKARASAKNALRMAQRGKNKFYIVESKIHLGYTLFLSGEIEEAKKLFREAGELEKEIGSDAGELYSHRGVHHIDCLTSLGKTDDAFKISIRNLSYCIEHNWPFHISKCYRCLGGLYRIKGDGKKAEEHIEEALEIARRVGVPHLEIEALIERGRLFVDMEGNEHAIRDANEVLKVCEWTGFRLYEPEAEIVLGKAYLWQKKYDQAQQYAKSAYEKAISMKYRWAEGDAAHLLGEIYLASDDKTNARKWLQKAVACRKEIQDPKVKESQVLIDTEVNTD